MSAAKIPSGRLNTSIDNEILQSYVAKSECGEACTAQVPKPSEDGKEKEVKPASSRGSKKSSGKGKKGGVKEKKRRSARSIKHEEVYTDKDRAAAVNMGSRDIKQSLKLKRQQDRSKNMLIPEEADPAQYLVLGYHEMGRKELQIALTFFNKAIELNPLEKQAMVARSKCYILLGQPDKGLQDAETALTLDKSFLKAIYQKAEALYHLGDFEHSLMYFHRGLHVRPDHEGFKAGVEKAQKAIETALGIGVARKVARSRATTPARSVVNFEDKGSVSATPNKNVRAKSNTRLLRELAVDKEYLDGLLSNPNIRCKAKEGQDDPVVGYIKDAVDYLNQRQEFWRQQVCPRKK